MKFGPVPIQNSAGAILAHSVALNGKRLRKSHVLTEEDIAALAATGVTEVVVAMLQNGDIGEDDAALAIVEAMSFSGITAGPATTGRVNLYADAAGVFEVEKSLIDALNGIDPSMTVATLAEHSAVARDQMVATVKIIPYAVSGRMLEIVLGLCRRRPVFHVHPFRAATVGLVQTTLSTVKDSVLDKTVSVTQARLDRSGSHIASERRVPHEAAAVAAAAKELAASFDVVLVFGASAVSDQNDVIPAAIRLAGGTVTRTGMPVDPGNLLVLGKIGGKPVIGAPGCARSPKENGFDWVLDRTLAGMTVGDRDIAGMGVGGLLMEIASRPQPREVADKVEDPKVYAVVLAAGRSSRMGGPNKLLAEFDDKPLIRRTVDRVVASGAEGVVVVTGHQPERIRDALHGLEIEIIQSLAYADGLSSSLRTGIGALPRDAQGALIVLGDMPGITIADYNHMVGEFRRAGGRTVVRATHNGKRGNPVILPRALFGAVAQLEGDTGARHLIESEGVDVIDVELGEGASIDVDTPEAMLRAGGVLQG